MNSNEIKASDKQKILKFFTDKKISKFLYRQLRQMYQIDLSKNYLYTLTIESNHFYIYVQAIKKSGSHIGLSEDYASTYCIKITKSFPLSGVRVYLLKHFIHPRINDGRDLLQEIIGTEWSYKKKLQEIINGIDNFQDKLYLRHEKFRSVQRTGQFQIGDTFTQHQLSKFSALDIYPDLTKDEFGALVCVSQTHLVVFKSILNKSDTTRIYQLFRACDLQCIRTILHQHHDNQIIMKIIKYKVDTTFNEYEQLKKKYIIENAEEMIGKILKNIGKYQKCEMDLVTSSNWHQENGFNDIFKAIKSCEKIQNQLEKNAQISSSKRQSLINEISERYRHIIEYFSSRGDSYHHIYVNKMNNLCQAYH